MSAPSEAVRPTKDALSQLGELATPPGLTALISSRLDGLSPIPLRVWGRSPSAPGLGPRGADDEDRVARWCGWTRRV
ncbi:MAG: hypothetical protein ACYCST_17225, partial [Acidimicrobiales bacterium]